VKDVVMEFSMPTTRRSKAKSVRTAKPPFKEGDRVRCVVPMMGPVMWVEHIRNGRVTCWYWAEGVFKTVRLPIKILKVVT
jgi:hypothetical protein